MINTPDDALAQTLEEIDAWKWQRSDLNAWIKVLNKFDTVLEDVIREYDIDKLQVREFSTESKKMVSEILKFERLLLENSTNRKMFNSYDVRNPFVTKKYLSQASQKTAIEQLSLRFGPGRSDTSSEAAFKTFTAVLSAASCLTSTQYIYATFIVFGQTMAPPP